MADTVQDSLSNDLYTRLGVAPDAAVNEIKRAYQRMAGKYHPDRNPGNPDAEEQFKLINEAYDTLKDPQSRAQYDAQRVVDVKNALREQFNRIMQILAPPEGALHEADLNELFERAYDQGGSKTVYSTAIHNLINFDEELHNDRVRHEGDILGENRSGTYRYSDELRAEKAAKFRQFIENDNIDGLRAIFTAQINLNKALSFYAQGFEIEIDVYETDEARLARLDDFVNIYNQGGVKAVQQAALERVAQRFADKQNEININLHHLSAAEGDPPQAKASDYYDMVRPYVLEQNVSKLRLSFLDLRHQQDMLRAAENRLSDAGIQPSAEIGERYKQLANQLGMGKNGNDIGQLSKKIIEEHENRLSQRTPHEDAMFKARERMGEPPSRSEASQIADDFIARRGDYAQPQPQQQQQARHAAEVAATHTDPAKPRLDPAPATNDVVYQAEQAAANDVVAEPSAAEAAADTNAAPTAEAEAAADTNAAPTAEAEAAVDANDSSGEAPSDAPEGDRSAAPEHSETRFHLDPTKISDFGQMGGSGVGAGMSYMGLASAIKAGDGTGMTISSIDAAVSSTDTIMDIASTAGRNVGTLARGVVTKGNYAVILLDGAYQVSQEEGLVNQTARSAAVGTTALAAIGTGYAISAASGLGIAATAATAATVTTVAAVAAPIAAGIVVSAAANKAVDAFKATNELDDTIRLQEQAVRIDGDPEASGAPSLLNYQNLRRYAVLDAQSPTGDEGLSRREIAQQVNTFEYSQHPEVLDQLEEGLQAKIAEYDAIIEENDSFLHDSVRFFWANDDIEEKREAQIERTRYVAALEELKQYREEVAEHQTAPQTPNVQVAAEQAPSIEVQTQEEFAQPAIQRREWAALENHGALPAGKLEYGHGCLRDQCWNPVQNNTEIVEKGDTIWRMTQDHFGLTDHAEIAEKVKDVLALNNMTVDTARSLQIGQEVVFENNAAVDDLNRNATMSAS